MIDKIINDFIKYLNATLSRYHIKYETLYNSDLEMVSQYSKSLSVRSLFNQGDLKLIREDDFDKLQNKDYILCMYNYSPLSRVENRFNNINFEMVFNPRTPVEESLRQFGKLRESEGSDGHLNLYHLVREGHVDAESLEGHVRDMVYGTVNLNFKFMTVNTTALNDIQFIHNKTLQRNQSYSVLVRIGGRDHEFEYKTSFEPIDQIGHIDYNSYGNLQQLSFSVAVEGPVFSFYTKDEDNLLDRIEVTVDSI